jgi:vacuolar-type H+-ATPase subunit E/Vma4
MEVVKSSEALESQIVEDARAKARRILEAAEKECVAVRAEWNRRSAEDERRLDASRDAQCRALQQELDASLPLDFMRTRLSFTQEAVSKALQDLFDSLSEADIRKVLAGCLSRVKSAFSGARVTVEHAGISAELARSIVREGLPGVTIDAVTALSGDAAADSGRGVIVQTVDGRRRFRGTLKEVTGVLLEDHREELVTALFGKDVER